MQSCQYIVVMGSTAEHQAEGRIVIIIIYGINAIELLLAHTTHVHTSIVLAVSRGITLACLRMRKTFSIFLYV